MGSVNDPCGRCSTTWKPAKLCQWEAQSGMHDCRKSPRLDRFDISLPRVGYVEQSTEDGYRQCATRIILKTTYTSTRSVG
jgi:hypothetical protein